MNIRSAFIILFLLIGIFAKGAIRIVVNNKANASIVGDKQSIPVKNCIENLNSYIFKVSSTKLGVKSNRSDNENNIIILLDPLDKGLQNYSKDSFRFFCKRNDFYIIGKSTIGLEFGANQFLEEFLDISWLMPTDIGEYINRKSTIELPEINKIYSPDFKSRLLSPINPLGNDILGIWGKRNKLFGEVQFHHNMNKISGGQFQGANQPNFEDSEFYYRSYNNIDAILSKSKVTSFSLGINDSKKFNFKNSQINSIGLKNYSDTYYSWVNNIVTQLNKKHKNITYGLLAYYNVFDPPRDIISLPNNVIPYITIERTRWENTEFVNNYKKTVATWKIKANKLGMYDYNYGYYYLLPRIYTASLGKSIRWHYLNNFEYYYSEVYPNFIEGPKYWILAKMLWSSNLDAKSLEAEWARKCVGKNASIYLLKFYKLLEDYWYIVFKNYDYRSTYMAFNNLSYLDGINDSMLIQLDDLLQKTLQLTSNSSERARANVLIKMWNFQRMSIKMVKERKAKFFIEMKSNPKFLKMLNDLNDPISSLSMKYFKMGLGM